MRYEYHDPVLARIASECKAVAVVAFTAASLLVIAIACVLVDP